jgi:hypothetical protein
MNTKMWFNEEIFEPIKIYNLRDKKNLIEP